MDIKVTTIVEARLGMPHRSHTVWESPKGSKSTPWLAGDTAVAVARLAASEMRERHPEHRFTLVTSTRSTDAGAL